MTNLFPEGHGTLDLEYESTHRTVASTPGIGSLVGGRSKKIIAQQMLLNLRWRKGYLQLEACLGCRVRPHSNQNQNKNRLSQSK